MNNNFIKEYCRDYFKVDINKIEVKKRFFGGKSNSMFLVLVDGDLYTFRIPGSNSSLFVNRNYEKENIKLIDEINISNKTLHIDEESGITISKFIEGNNLEGEEFSYSSIAELLKKLHTSKILFNNDYNPFSRLNKYEGLNKEIANKEKYLLLKEKLLLFKPFLEKVKIVAAHNDFQPANIIKQENCFFLIDWEFSGNNDPIYDIACFGNVNLEDSVRLLKTYYENPTNNEYKRLYLWRMFQCLQWFNVATFKDSSGLSEELNIDFKKVAQIYLEKAEYLSQIIN